ncbi:MAG: response regulator [Rhodothermales bacterium]|nr:response regulator [Rhodothermales bacterium]MBO6779894.1 response regulator [Rhodothermales bacterium]
MSLVRHIGVTAIAVFLLVGSATGQAVRFSELGVGQGRSFAGIEQMVVDELGFLWFGKTRWDGVEFREFPTVVGDSVAMLGHAWDGLFADAENRVWIGTDIGLVVFEYATGTFRNVQLPPAPDGDQPWIDPIVQAPGGMLVLGSWNSGVYLLDPETEQVRHIPLLSGSNDVRSLTVDSEGRVWAASPTGGVFYIDVAGAEAQSWTTTCGDRVQSVARSESGGIWIGGPEGICRSGLGKVFDIREVVDLLEDGDGRLWIGTESGLFIRDASGGVVHVTGPPATERIFSLTVDPSGTVWVATERGIHFADPGAGRVVTIDRLAPDGRNLAVASAALHWQQSGGFDARETVLLGTRSAGLAALSVHEMTVRAYPTQPRLPSLNVRALSVDAMRRLWIGTDQGLVRMGMDLTVQSVDPGGALESAYVQSIAHDRSGNAWVLTQDERLHRVGPQDDVRTWPREAYLADSPHATSYALHLQVHPLDPAAVYISTFHEGLVRFEPGSGRTTRYGREAPDRPGLAGNAVFSSWLPTPEFLWVAAGTGLYRFTLDANREPVQVRRFTTRDGLPSDIVRALVPSPDGVLWIGTEVGIARLDLQTGEITVLGAEHGATEGIIEHHAALVTPSGRVVMGGNEGISVILDGAPGPEPVRSPRITRLWVGGVPRDFAPSIELAESVTLAHDENFLEFDFSAMALTSSGSLRYRLRGLDPGWRAYDERTRASYPNLDPGTYWFEVEAPNGMAATLAVKVRHPWWNSPVSRTGYGVFAVLGLIGFVTGRTRRLRRRTQELERDVFARTKELDQKRKEAEENAGLVARQASELRKLEQTKSRLFANVSHEFRTPLTLIEGPLADALASSNGSGVFLPGRSAERMLRQSRHLKGLVDRLLEVARIESAQLEFGLSRSDPGDVVFAIVDGFADEADRRGITLSCSGAVDALLWVDADKLHHIVGNLVANAITHTPRGGRVEVETTVAGARLRIRVIDTGVGIGPDRLASIFERFNSGTVDGTGIGLALVHDLVSALGGEISVASEPGKGSTFTVSLPAWERPPDLDNLVIAEPETPHSVVPRELISIPSSDGASTKGGNLVLVVEDNPDVRSYLREVLEPVAAVAEASEGSLGLELAEQLAPDAIVSDVMMPGMDGYALVSAVRASEDLELTPVILLTAKVEDSDVARGLQGGADVYLRKPFSAQVLRAQVRRLIERHRAQRERLARPTPLPADGLGTGATVREARRLVLQSIDRTSVEALASEMAMSSRTLHRRLRDEAGVGPQVFIRTVRLSRAEELLREERLGVEEVALMVGYGSTKNFRAHFRRQFGYLPGEARMWTATR